MKRRGVGLTREVDGPLLSTFQETPETKVEDVDVTAPPLSSDDESEAAPKVEYQGSDSDESQPRQNEMKKTKFQEKKRSRSSEPGVQRNVRARTATSATRGARGRVNIRVPKLAGRPTSPGDNEGKHMEDSSGFVKRSRSNKTFGKNSQRSSQNSVPNSSAPQGSSEKAKLQRHSLSESPTASPEKAVPSRARLIAHSPSLSPTKASSQSKQKPRAAFKPPAADDFDDLNSDSDDRKTHKSRNEVNAAKAKAEKLHKRPAFKVPQLEGFDSIADEIEGTEVLSTQQLGFMDDGSLDEGLKLELSSDDDLLENIDRQRPSLFAHCPMCGQTVDSELLKRHTTRGRMTIRQQTTFCLSHKRREAEEIRKSNRYPEVDWDGLEARFTEHKDFIKDVLEGKRASYFASLLSNKVETGKDRTLLKTDESLTPGYYGPRGLRLMTDFILHSFSDTVRKRAVEDHLVAARTYTGYVQSVLVPELAVRLIMEDMDVDEEDARKIMHESSDLGDVLHEETRDVVVRDSDDED
ncbi:hypothetical protein PG993_006571 [Apiospora rasikravindrae]|uniref:Restriction of telomere capping protein 4 n=1 Tax=Apiospora rasikravindrae TaxID=990691 RepID=A0ABR1T8K4_9PEZI